MRKQLRDKVYGAHITLVWGKPSEAERYVRRAFGDTDRIKDDTLAITMYYEVDGKPRYVVWFREIPSISTLAHEALHLTLFVMEYVEAKVNASEAEPACYYLEFLINAMRDAFVKWAPARDTIV